MRFFKFFHIFYCIKKNVRSGHELVSNGLLQPGTVKNREVNYFKTNGEVCL